MIKAILFDAYGTLLDTGIGSIKATECILNKNNLNFDARTFYARWKLIHKDYINTLKYFFTEEEIFLKDLEKLYNEFHIKGNVREDVEIMLRTLGNRSTFPETATVLNILKSNYKIYIASTSDHSPLMDDISRNNIHVNGVFSSELLKVYKPKKEFYLQILNEIDCQPFETLFVGDSLDDDVWGPQSVGMKAVWINRKKQTLGIQDPAPEFIIQSLDSLLDILEALESNNL